MPSTESEGQRELERSLSEIILSRDDSDTDVVVAEEDEGVEADADIPDSEGNSWSMVYLKLTGYRVPNRQSFVHFQALLTGPTLTVTF